MASDYKPKSSEHEIEKFKDSIVFQDFLNEVDVRIEDFRDLLENADSKTYIAAQGAVKLAREFRNIFEDLLENKRADNREEAQKRTEED